MISTVSSLAKSQDSNTEQIKVQIPNQEARGHWNMCVPREANAGQHGVSNVKKRKEIASTSCCRDMYKSR